MAALTASIQSTKLLHDASSTKFQVMKFALVIDIVDRLGILVY